MGPLEGGIQHYAWGSKSHVRALAGEPPAKEPEAEVWFGDHPVLPSTVTWQGEPRSLADVIRSDPARILGEHVSKRFGDRMPFLLKLLAAETPLSLQAHPSEAQARAGFDREEKLGLARTAPNRNYKDPNHKPELLCALTKFHALCGFRSPEETLRIFLAMGLKPERFGLVAGPEPSEVLRAAFRAHFALAKDARRALTQEVVASARRVLAGASSGASLDPSVKAALSWIDRIGALYPEDIGVVQTAFLNVIELAPYEAVYLPAGNLHAYLGGFGVEIMAASDNVLRGGLTPKYVDETELMRVLDFTPRADWRVETLPEIAAEGARRHVYATPAPEFRLTRYVVANGALVACEGRGPHIVLGTRGSVEVVREDERFPCTAGRAVFVEHGSDYALLGDGEVFCASVGTDV